MAKKSPKKFYCDILVAPDMVDRFKKGCEYYGMTCKRKRDTHYYEVGTDEIANIYWLAANLYDELPTSGITKRAF